MKWCDVPELKEFHVNPAQPLDAIPVPTAESLLRSFLMEALLSRGKHVYVRVQNFLATNLLANW